MPRWRKRNRRALTAQQKAVLTGGTVFAKQPGETDADVITRHFGSWEGARDAWAAFRDALMAGSPPGSRPWGYWQFEVKPGWEADMTAPPPPGLRKRKPSPMPIRPLPWDEGATLRRLKALTPLELLQLKET